MNHHLRFLRAPLCPRVGATALLAIALLSSCSSSTKLALTGAAPPPLAGDQPFIQFQCYFFTAPRDFELLKATEGSQVAGIYSPEDGEELLRKLKSRRAFDLVSSPSVTCRQGEQGRIELIREFIYPTEYAPPKVPADASESEGVFPVTPATPAEFESTNLGITGTFKGSKRADGTLDIEFDLQRRTFLGFVNYGSPITAEGRTSFGRSVPIVITENRIEMPVFDLKRVQSRLTLANGQFLALGRLSPDASPQLDKVTAQTAESRQGDDGEGFFVLITARAVDSSGR